jgi:hypothetical protein
LILICPDQDQPSPSEIGRKAARWPIRSERFIVHSQNSDSEVLSLGTTDPLAGFASVTANLVVSFYFAKRGFENVARIIKR